MGLNNLVVVLPDCMHNAVYEQLVMVGLRHTLWDRGELWHAVIKVLVDLVAANSEEFEGWEWYTVGVNFPISVFSNCM